MTDLIARLELFEQSMARCAIEGHDNPSVPWCDYCTNLRDKRDMLLADNLPAILRALKVQQAAEAYVDAGESFLLVIDGKLCCPCCDSPEPWDGEVPDFIHKPGCKLDALVRVVKGEQP